MSLDLSLKKPVSRLAPTPSGYLHIGNIYSFVLTAMLVRRQNGVLHLRIDDIDAARSKAEYLEDIFSQLDWLGLTIDFGPSNVADFKKNFSQHLFLNSYQKFLQTLAEQNKLYACSCSRSQVAAVADSHIYPGTCRLKNLPINSEDHHLRYNVQNSEMIEFDDIQRGFQKINLKKDMGDFVVKRKGGLPAYQLVSMAEDIKNKINLIIRGEDLLTSTAAQIELSKYFNHDYAQKVQFLHHPLLSESADLKLSKSHNSLSLQKMREHGTTKAQIYSFLAKAYGFKNNKISRFEVMLEEFQHSKLELKSTLGIQL